MCAYKHLVERAVIAAAAMMPALFYSTLYASVYLLHNTISLSAVLIQQSKADTAVNLQKQDTKAFDRSYIIARYGFIYTDSSDNDISYFSGRRYIYSVFVKIFHFFSRAVAVKTAYEIYACFCCSLRIIFCITDHYTPAVLVSA